MRSSSQAQTQKVDTEYVDIAEARLRVSRVALGTWAMGGWMWGGTDERESIATIRAALDHGINLIDTASAYGFGVSEEIVGKALVYPSVRAQAVIATKVGLEWRGDEVYRNATRDRIMYEIDESLRRLRTDHIDIYQVHWPDPLVPIEETAEAMHRLYAQGKIRAIGVSNFSVAQMDRFGYGALCRGLLSGRMRANTTFEGDDLRRRDPKFQLPRFTQYLAAVRRLDQLAQERFDRRVIHLAVRWMLDQGISVALWGGRRPDQLLAVLGVAGWSLDAATRARIDRIVSEAITDPVGPEFMAPPPRPLPPETELTT